MNLTSLNVELFVSDMNASVDFYERILGFQVGEQEEDGYTVMKSGPATIALSTLARVPTRHQAYVDEGERPGRGIEIVLWVEGLQEMIT